MRYFVSIPLLLEPTARYPMALSTFVPSSLLARSLAFYLFYQDTGYGIKFLKDGTARIYFYDSPLLIPRLSVLF